MNAGRTALLDQLLQHPSIAGDRRARELAVVLTSPTGRTSGGHPYLQEPAWVRLRDWVPHILDDGPGVIAAVDAVAAAAAAAGASVDDAAKVVRQVVLTASVTAPPDLWLLRQVLAAFARLGLSKRLLDGERLRPASLSPVLADEVQVDLGFLLSRGLLRGAPGGGLRMADHDTARAVFAWVPPTVPSSLPSSLASAWARLFRGSNNDDVHPGLRELLEAPLPTSTKTPGWFAPSPREIELGFRLVPIVLGLRAAEKHAAILDDGVVQADHLCGGDVGLGAALLSTLANAGVVEADRGGNNGLAATLMAPSTAALTPVGRRVLEKGIGPFGIIEAYHQYMTRLDEILVKGRGAVWVERGANVAASQDANRHTFELANDALDRFCTSTGFRFSLFIEHALGKGEATRQRWQRSPELRFVGADLEDAAIDAAVAERDAGKLPSSMIFVRGADIGQPSLLVDALRRHGLDPHGAVMVVGNGFHEVRDQTDVKMTAVLKGYADAGIVLLFTEETGLSVSDLLETAWNTYHAGFKYVHERSGQGLRPAEERAPSPFERTPPLSWSECATAAGYVRVDAFSPRGRTVHPYTPASGVNPSITVTHFCVPRALALGLKLA